MARDGVSGRRSLAGDRCRAEHRVVRRILLAIFVVVALVAGGVFLTYRRQIVSYLTHWKGGPSSTVAYVPFDPPPSLRLAVAGDTGDSGNDLDRLGAGVAALGAADPYDVLLLLGDLVYPSGDPAALPSVVDEPFAAVIAQGTELLAILGNHDVKLDRGDELLADLGMPGRWWAREFGVGSSGGLLIVGLDSTDMTNVEQLDFLERTLATSTATWKVVAVHHPPYSAGYQGSSLDVREVIAPLAERYGVQLVLSGHDHDYQRSEVIGGVTYVVSGAGSGVRRTDEASFTEVAYAFVHSLDIAVFEDRLVVRAVGTDGRVADEVTIAP